MSTVFSLSITAQHPPDLAQRTGQPANVGRAVMTKPADTVVELNSATLYQLRLLPGVGDVFSSRIVRNRPYRVKSELLNRGVLPAALYFNIKDRLVIQPK